MNINNLLAGLLGLSGNLFDLSFLNDDNITDSDHLENVSYWLNEQPIDGVNAGACATAHAELIYNTNFNHISWC